MRAIAFRAHEVEVPTGWAVVRMKDITTFVNRGVTPKYQEEPSEYWVFSQKCVRPDRSLDLSLGKYHVPDSSLDDSDARLRDGDVVINSTGVGTLGRAGFIAEADIRDRATVVIDSHVTVLRCDEAICDPRYLWYLLSTDAFYRFANAALSVGSTNQTELGREAIRRFGLALPPLDTQRVLASWLDEECLKLRMILMELGASQPVAGSLSALLVERRQALVEGAASGVNGPGGGSSA